MGLSVTLNFGYLKTGLIPEKHWKQTGKKWKLFPEKSGNFFRKKAESLKFPSQYVQL